MTITSPSTTTRTTQPRDERDDTPTVLLDTAGTDSRRTRRFSLAVLAGVLVVMAGTAAIATRGHEADHQPVTSTSSTTASDAAESGHGTRAGVVTGTGLPVTGAVSFAAAPASDRAQMVHGGPGSRAVGR
jgi:hypothetical protein